MEKVEEIITQKVAKVCPQQDTLALLALGKERQEEQEMQARLSCMRLSPQSDTHLLLAHYSHLCPQMVIDF